VATKVFVGNTTYSLNGSPDKRIMEDKDGIFWSMVVAAASPNGKAIFYYSRNSGSTWISSPTSDLSMTQTRGLPSMYIDQDGYAHVTWVKYEADPQVLIYARGTPVKLPNNTISGSGTVTAADIAAGNYIPGWTWKKITISPVGGRLGIDSDVIAFRNGAGWVAFTCYSLGTAGGCQVARVNITSNGTLSIGATTMGPSAGLEATQYGTIEFNHTGDGVTPAAAPHLFLGTACGSNAGIRLNRATYSGGVWTWGTPISLGTGVVDKTTACGVWDGSRYMFAWAPNSATISCVEWDGVAGAATTRSPPAAPGGVGVVAGLSLSCDPVTDDIYLAFHDVTDGDIRWSKFTRATLTWSAWAVAVGRTASIQDGQVSLPRHPKANTIPMLYSIITGTTPAFVYTLYTQLLATLVRTPPTPTLLSPVSGAKLNLALGGTFTWQYNPIAPGDIESGYVFKRVQGVTTDYWNATTQAFQAGTVTNTTDPNNPSQVTFPAAKWTNGLTYTWAVQVVSSGGSSSAFTSARTVLSAASPVVAVTAPNNVVYDESTPLVEWTYTSLDAQRDYEVRIVPEGPGISPTDPLGAVWTSGVVSSSVARSVRIEQPLTNNTTYRAYVKATSVTAIASDWMYSSFSIFVTPPSGPLVEVVDEIDYVSGVPRVRLDLTGQSSFLSSDQDGSATGWESDVNATLADVAEDPGNRLLGFSITSVAAGAMGARSAVGSPPLPSGDDPSPTRPLSFPVQSGTAYTLMASFRAGATTRAVRLRIRWYDDDDGSGSVISESVSAQVNATNAAYVATSLTDVAPAGAVLARIVLEVLATAAAAEVFYVGLVSFHPGREVAYQPGGFAANETLRVERSDDGGATFLPVILRVKPNFRQIAIAYDRLMPFGTDVIYRAYTDIDQGLGSTLSSAASAQATINLEAQRWGVRDTENPDQAELYAYVTEHDRGDDESSSVHRPAGRFWPIVDTEGLQAATGTLTIFVPVGDINYATDVLKRTSIFVLQNPTGTIFFARLIRRKYNVEQLRHRNIVVDYVEVDPVLGVAT
jgi:hypothetical protein